MALAEGRFYIVDVEGNGARPPEIVEIAIVEIDNLNIVLRRMHWLVRPQAPIAPMASRIHGIRDRDVAGSPTMEDIAEDLMTWLDGAAIVGHNVRVDLDALTRGLPDLTPRAAVDTLALTRTLRPGLDSYALTKLAPALGLDERASKLSDGKAHSAPHDAIVTALLFIDLVSSLPEPERDPAIERANVLSPRQGALL